ncbi:MAG: ORF6N domain-containing protein [Candidatus Symbiothrix sp.]|jgi:hypothetical protein|nr:ORF6N domain-containing protein [Candidatus Symbiothrix sp.]
MINYELRGQKVLIDRDLAQLYGVETKRLKEAVRRNIERFQGDDFMFQLTKEEFAECSRSQFVTLNTHEHLRTQIASSSWGGARYQPFAFTELGVAMLSSVLNSPTAIEINRTIMRTFVAIRQYMSHPLTDRVTIIEHDFKNFAANIEDAFADYNDINEDTRMQLELISESLAELQAHKKIIDKPRNPIGFLPPPRTDPKKEEENTIKESENPTERKTSKKS